METKQILKNFLSQNEEKGARIKELEEQLRHIEKDKIILREFKVCAEKFRA
jgi:hypothetical protein